MKIKMVILTLCVGLFGFASVVSAEEEGVRADSKIHVGAGLKIWYNGWNSFSFWNNGLANAHIGVETAPAEVSIIPNVSIVMGNIVFLGQYMASTNYVLGSWEAERSEYDLSVGYMLPKLPGVVIAVGFKNVDQAITSNPGKLNASTLNVNYAGPFVGISGSASVSDSGAIGVYGNFAYGTLEETSSFADGRVGGRASSGVAYTNTEVGIRMSFSDHVYGTVGYRNQIMKSAHSDRINPVSSQDVTDGLTIGLNTVF